MELEFNGKDISYFDTVLETTILREELMEMIVPDSCPDILRILDTDGKLCLKSKEVRAGGVDIGGEARMELLYLPEGERGVFRLDLSIPFQYPFDSGLIGAASHVSVLPCLQSAETRVINPRKVLVRVNLLFRLCAASPVRITMMQDLAPATQQPIETLPGSREASFLTALEEKSFSFSDELTISAGKPEAKQLMKSSVTLSCTDARIIGSKLIFKGEAQIGLLYLSMENTFASAEYALPFSQLIEVSGAEEDADCDISLVLTSVEFALGVEGAGNRGQISVSLGMLAQAAVRETKQLDYIADIYSLSGELLPEIKTTAFSILHQPDIRRQSVRELIETGVLAKSVLSARMSVGEVSQSREAEKLTLSAAVDLTVLYFDEDDTLCSAVRRIAVSCQTEFRPDGVCSATARAGGELFVSPAAGGMEVRFNVAFSLSWATPFKLAWVSGACLEETVPEPRAQGEPPSLILRRPGPHESLWDIAKSCRTTRQEIRSANALENDALIAGTLLLIPLKR